MPITRRDRAPGRSTLAEQMASRNGTVMRPSVSPWKEARRNGVWSAAPAAGCTIAAYRSPAAGGEPALDMREETSAVSSSTSSFENLLHETSTTLFWSRFVSRHAGSSTWKRSLSAADLAMASVNDAAHSWRKMASTSAYCSSRMRSVRATLLVDRAPQRALLTLCHESGATVLSMCTRMASKMAQQRVCSGRLIASSFSVMAGYFALGMTLRRV
mmetsp:Transcript_57568/g.129791  ORF Transcript_57568/g.129791 Transcript_57568/m.129791 type:complete len:215 (-) Transcript_57568:266-910(-)